MSAQLTGLLAEIAEVAGEDAALAIARARGGTIAGIPAARNLRESDWIVQTVGMDKARRIAERLVSAEKGDRFKIPLGPEAGANAFFRAQRAAITEALESGASIGEAAQMAGASRNAVLKIKARLRRGDDSQGTLF